MTSLESLLCNSCGAPLSVPKQANFVKCNHCETQLHVRRDEGVTFTESIDQLKETTQALQQQVERLTSQQAVAELDRNWESRKDDFMVTGKHGHKSLPTQGGALVGGLIAAGFGLVWTVMTARMGSSGPGPGAGIFPLFGLLFIAGGVFSAISASGKAQAYKRARAEYQRKRAKLINADESSSHLRHTSNEQV